MKLLPIPCLATLLAVASATAQDRSILPYLPKDTVLAVAAPNLTTSIEEFGKMPLAKMWREEEVQAFLADVKELVKKQFEEGMARAKEMHAQGALPFDPDVVKDLRVEAATFALTTMSFTKGDFGPNPRIGVVMHLDFGASAPAWTKLIQTLLSMMEAKAGDEITKKESKVGDVQILSFAPNDARGIEMALNVAMVPGGVLIGSLASDLTAIVENMNAKKPALTATAGYQAATKRIATPGAECEIYFRPSPLVDMVVSLLRLGVDEGELSGLDMDGVERVVTALNLRDLGSMSWNDSYVDGKSVGRSFWAPGKAAEGTAAAPKTLDTSFLKWVPKDAVTFSASTLNVMPIYDFLVKGLNAYDPEFAKMALAQLGEMEKQLGFNIRDDLFGSIGDHMISWSMPMGSIQAAPEVAMLLKVKDEQKIVNVLKNLTKLSNGMVDLEEGEKRGLKVYQFRINADPTQGMGPVNLLEMFQPTFAFKNGYLVGGLSPGDVKRVFQRMDREDDPKGDIRSNKEYAAVASTLPAGIDSVSFTDWKQQFESGYQMATGLLAFLPMGDDVPIDTSLLPDAATLTKHLFGSLSWTKTDAQGTETLSTGPFGAEMLLVLGVLGVGGIGAAVAVPQMMRR